MVKKNSKGQVGETITWIIATILIIVILVFFIFGSSLLAGSKKVSNTFQSSPTSSQVKEISGTFLRKSLFTYVMADSNSQAEIDKVLWNMSLSGEFGLDYNQTKKEMVLDYDLG